MTAHHQKPFSVPVAQTNVTAVLTNSQQNQIRNRLKAHDLRLLYLFGSAARGEMTKDSDYDLAVLTGKPFPSADRFHCGLDLGVILNRDVDLIDLRDAPESLKIQVIQKGIPLYAASPREQAEFEMVAISDYTRFNEERRSAINRIRESGRIYGQ